MLDSRQCSTIIWGEDTKQEKPTPNTTLNIKKLDFLLVEQIQDVLSQHHPLRPG